MRPVKCFIVGCSRSGTTLLSVLLDRSSYLAVPPETGFYWEIAPRVDGALAETLAAWPRLAELGLDVETVLEACGSQPSPCHVLATMLSLYPSARGKPFCGEKTPNSTGPLARGAALYVS